MVIVPPSVEAEQAQISEVTEPVDASLTATLGAARRRRGCGRRGRGAAARRAAELNTSKSFEGLLPRIVDRVARFSV